ncbi:MAG: hypothetical protein COA79_14350 [Planctomycetota bacterium]|nr:MAG: hypothetical protein COA79_14350 [Planctomycetota bacterium]
MKNIIIYFMFIVCILFLTSCGNSSNISIANTPIADLENDFNKEKSISALKRSVLTVPNNLFLTSSSSSGKKYSSNNNELGENVYGKVYSNIDYAKAIKTNVIEYIEFLFESKDLSKVELNTKIDTDAGIITAFKLEDISKIEGENYIWKLSLYYSFSTKPDIICRLTFFQGKLKGQILQYGTEVLSKTIDGFTRYYNKYYNYDIRFDGIQIPQTLDIDYTIDMEETFNFANLYWRQLTTKETEELNISQISKSSLHVEFDGSIYGITGTSYSAGENLEIQLNRQVKYFGADRSTYTFRIKTLTNDTEGAKVDVALPVDTLEETSAIWENDSFANLFEQDIITFIKDLIVQYIDDIDDEYISNYTYFGTALHVSSSLGGSIEEEKRVGMQLIYSYLGNNIEIDKLQVHGTTISMNEFDEAKAFWGSDDFTDFNLNTLELVNAFLANTDTSDNDKEKVYYQIKAQSIITYYQENILSVNLLDISAYLENINDFKSNSFTDLIGTNIKLVNPAFFENTSGLLGTFNNNEFFQYDFIFDTLTIGEKPTNFDQLNALDLKSLTTIAPANVYNLTIEVK